MPEVRAAFEGGCEAGLKKESDALTAAAKKRLRSLGVRDVRIKGDRANVWLEGQGGEPGTVRRVDGQWLDGESLAEEGAMSAASRSGASAAAKWPPRGMSVKRSTS